MYQLLLWNLSILFIIRLFITPTCPQYWLFVENDWHWLQVDTEWRNTDWCVNNLDKTSTRPLWLDFSAFTAWITSKSTLLSPFFCFSPQVGHSRRVMSISLKPYVFIIWEIKCIKENTNSVHFAFLADYKYLFTSEISLSFWYKISILIYLNNILEFFG